MQDIESIKQPALDYPVHPLIASRWSPRAYDTRPVEREKLQRIFEAARWAATICSPGISLLELKVMRCLTK
jgi:hypothetical protein